MNRKKQIERLAALARELLREEALDLTWSQSTSGDLAAVQSLPRLSIEFACK
jgi:hypothetical protein